MSLFRSTGLILMCVLAALSPAALRGASTAPQYVLVDLGTLGGSNSEALGINSSGQVVGSSNIKSNTNYHGFLYANGKMTDLKVLSGGGNSSATAINDSGQVVGWSEEGALDSNGFNMSESVVFSGGNITNLGALAGDSDSEALGINNSGNIVGQSYTVDSNGAYLDLNPYIYTNGKMSMQTKLNAQYFGASTGVNSSGQATGWCDSGGNDSFGNAEFRAVRWAAGGGVANLGVIGSETNSVGEAINDSGNVTGYSYANTAASVGGVAAAFIYSNNSMKLLSPLPHGFNSYGYAINATGAIAGQSDIGVNSSNQLIYHGVLYIGSTAYDLNSIVVNGTGWRIYEAKGINSSGKIAASAYNATGQSHALLLSPLASAPPYISKQPVTQTTVKPGASVTLTVTAVGANLGYLWRKNGISLGAPNSAKLVLTKITGASAGNYTVFVYNGNGNITSNTAVLNVITTPASITTQPRSLLNQKAGATLKFMVVAKGDAPIYYQWQSVSGNVATDLQNTSNYSGVTAATMMITKANAGNAGTYQVKVWNAVNAASPKVSNPVSLTFKK